MPGPGKRGSLAESKATVSEVHLITHTDGNMPALGYTSKGINYEIPHLILNTESNKIEFSISKELKDRKSVLEEFKKKCQKPDTLKIKKLIHENMSSNTILIGIADDIEENFNCFILMNKENSREITGEVISETGNKFMFSEAQYESVTYKPLVFQQKDFKEDYFRYMVKWRLTFSLT